MTSSTPLTCTVNPDTASVSFLIAGSCTLTAQVAAGADYSGAVGDPQTFTISLATPTTPTITNLPSSGAADTHFTAVVATTGDGATSVISSTPAVCTASGLVVAFVEPGICTLEAQVAAGAAYGAAEGSPQNVSVTVTISSVVFSGTEANPTVTVVRFGIRRRIRPRHPRVERRHRLLVRVESHLRRLHRRAVDHECRQRPRILDLLLLQHPDHLHLRFPLLLGGRCRGAVTPSRSRHSA